MLLTFLVLALPDLLTPFTYSGANRSAKLLNRRDWRAEGRRSQVESYTPEAGGRPPSKKTAKVLQGEQAVQ